MFSPAQPRTPRSIDAGVRSVAEDADNRFVRMLGIHFTDPTGQCGDRPCYSSDPPLTRTSRGGCSAGGIRFAAVILMDLGYVLGLPPARAIMRMDPCMPLDLPGGRQQYAAFAQHTSTSGFHMTWRVQRLDALLSTRKGLRYPLNRATTGAWSGMTAFSRLRMEAPMEVMPSTRESMLVSWSWRSRVARMWSMSSPRPW